jgi:PAS domain S-box-containing protein
MKPTKGPRAAQRSMDFARFIDIDEVRQLIDIYAQSAGLTMGILDLDGKVVATSNWQPICSEFHRRHPVSGEACERAGIHRGHLGEEQTMRTCPNGLIDATAPVIVAGQQVATVVMGQFLLAPPDFDRFRTQALTFGFNEEAYLAALKTVPVLDKEQAHLALRFLTGWAELLGKMGLKAQRYEALRRRQRRALSNLRASQRRYRLLFEESPAAMWEADFSSVKTYLRDTVGEKVVDFTDYLLKNPEVIAECERRIKVIDVNTAAVTMFEAADKADLVEQIDQIAVDSNIRRFYTAMMAGERSVTYEETNRTLSGKNLILEETCAVAPGHEELADRVYLIDVDITERKRAEMGLRAAEERYRTLVESLQEVVFTVDVQGVLTYVSPQVKEMLGYEAGELIGRNIGDLLHPDDHELVQAMDQQVRRGPFNPPVLHVFAADGTLRHLRVFTRPLNYAGVPSGAVGTAEDVTQLAQSERRRRQLEQRRRKLVRDLSETLDAAGKALARTVEMRDPYTAGHQERVARLAVAIATRLGISSRQLFALRVAAEIHDLGKMAVPAEILSKPGKLSEVEHALIRTHPDAAYQILRGLAFPGQVARIVRDHHERLNGSGYPRGLQGDAISRGALVLAVADVVEAMSAHRPYRAALGLEAAFGEITNQRGTLYDPDVVDACLAVFLEDGFSYDGADPRAESLLVSLPQ